MKVNLSLHKATLADQETVLSIFQKCPDYFWRVEGCLPTPEIVQNEMTGTPKKTSPAYLREFLILQGNNTPIGTVDLHIHHPEKGIGYIGLLLLIKDMQGRGIGKEAYQLIENECVRKWGIQRFRLGVSDDNDVSPFWRSLGFTPNGHEYDFQGANRMTHTVEYEKECK